MVPEGAYLIVDPIEGTEQDYAGAKELLKDKAGKFVLYDISRRSWQDRTHGGGSTFGYFLADLLPLSVRIPVPEGYDTAKLAVHRLNEDKTTVEYEVAMQEGMAYIQTDHFSKYALIEKGSMTDAGQTGGTDDTKTDGTASETPKTNDTADIMPYILLVAAAGAAAILAVAMNRKKQHSEK